MFGPVLPRAEAKRIGSQTYFTGEPCRRGHLTARPVLSGACRECSRLNLVANRSANPERTLATDRAFKERNRDAVRAADRRRYAADPEKYREKTKRRYREKGEDIRRKRREYHAKTYNDEAKAKSAKRSKEWNNKNRDRLRARLRNQKAARKNAPGKHSAEDVAAIMTLQGGKCAYCRRRIDDKYHVDHITPIARGGGNDRKNLQILCVPCNLSKGARDPIHHARAIGLLI
jgi:5-methylcytosine-specific restriction endonuclease McrA